MVSLLLELGPDALGVAPCNDDDRSLPGLFFTDVLNFLVVLV